MPAFDRRIMIIPTPGSARGTLRSLQATARPSRLQIRKNGDAEANLGLCVAIWRPWVSKSYTVVRCLVGHLDENELPQLGRPPI